MMSPAPFAADAAVRLEVDGATLHAWIAGEGPPIVFLHGGLADHHAALPFAIPLAARCRVIVPDLRGSGASVDPRPQRYARHADDVRAWLDHLGLDRAVVGGASGGCSVALRFALAHPDRLAGLVLVQPVHGGAEAGLTPAQAGAFAAMHAAAEHAVVAGIEALLPMYDALPEPVRSAAQAMARRFDPASTAASTALLASGAQPFERPAELAAITAPALLVPGADALHPAAVSALCAAHLPDCAVVDDGTTAVARIADFAAAAVGHERQNPR